MTEFDPLASLAALNNNHAGYDASLCQDSTRTVINPFPNSLGEKAYHGPAGAFVKAVDPHTEADPAAVLVQLLAAMSNIVGRRSCFKVDGALLRPNLFVLVVGQTSKGRKGTSYGHVEALASMVAPEWAQRCQVSGLSSGEGLIERIRDEVRNEADPTEVIKAAAPDKRVFVIESEFASVLKQCNREGNILSPILRDAWDSKTLRTLTTNPRIATNGHMSVVGHITKAELLRCLTQTEIANGLGNRFITIMAKRSKILPDGGQFEVKADDYIVSHFKDAVAFAQEDRALTRTAEARELWHSIYPGLSEGRPGLFGSMTGRSEAQVTKLALVYALLDHSPAVEVFHLQAALEIWRYAEDSCKHIFGESLGDATADAILSALKCHDDGLTRKQINHDLFRRNVKAKELDLAFNLLLSMGLAHFTHEQQARGGKAVERWFAGSGLRPTTSESLIIDNKNP
jgi:hypothetical protein